MIHETRDLNLPPWGPYSKHYAGISRILGGPDAAMLDFTFVLGHIRGKAMIPDVNFESGYHHWDATHDLRYLSYRYEIQWKDVEYADVEFFAHTTDSHLAKVTFHNRTNLPKEYVAAIFSVLRVFRHVDLKLEPGEMWIGAGDYASLDYPTAAGIPYLKDGARGLRRGVCRADLLVNKVGLGTIAVPYSRRHELFYRGGDTFVMQKGTYVRYTLDRPVTCRTVYLRYAMSGVKHLRLSVEVGGHAMEVALVEGSTEPLIGFSDLRMAHISLPAPQPIDSLGLRVVDVELMHDSPGFVLDGMLLSDRSEDPPADIQRRFSFSENAPRFEIARRPGRTGVVYTTAIQTSTGAAAVASALYSEDERPVPPPPYNDATLPQVYHSELSSTPILRRLNNDSLTNWHTENVILRGDDRNHFAGYSVGPVVVPPHHQRSIYVGLACGEAETTWAVAQETYRQRLQIEEDARARLKSRSDALPSSPYRFSQARMRTQLYTNVIYPESLGREFCRTYVPGKRFPSFIIWDSGMHGIGLNEYAPSRALEIVNQAMAFEDEDEMMAVLGGSPPPLHIYLLNEIYQTTGDRQMLATYYPRARKYQRFFSGQAPKSSYDRFGTGLLTPFAENGNSMGIDDYPAQYHVHQRGLSDSVSPACTTAHAIRLCKLTRLFAHTLGLDDDVAELTAWIDYLTAALQTYAWDEESGYYAYVINETKEQVTYRDGTNYNMGLDGVSPLVADISTKDQQRRQIAHLMTPGELWAPVGITAVAMNAPYYRPDGYWVGKVWIPHQWFMWKALIGAGSLDHAQTIAHTALRTWKNATDSTYNLWETFDANTGMGEGAHQFAGLSGPIAQFYHRYHTPGRITVGYDVVVHEARYAASEDAWDITLSTPFRTGATGMIAVVGRPGRYRVNIAGKSWEQITHQNWLNVLLDLESSHETITIRRQSGRRGRR